MKKNPKLTPKIEDKVFDLWSEKGWQAAEEYLKKLGFDSEKIDFIYDSWRELV